MLAQRALSPQHLSVKRSRRGGASSPVIAFYGWAKTKQAFAIGMLDGSQYGFAGLWESWKEENGTLLETFTIIMTAPNEIMEPLHDRMPVIIEPKDYDRWLQLAEAQALPLDLLRPFPAEKMKAWKANSRVGNVRNDEEVLLVYDDAPTLWG